MKPPKVLPVFFHNLSEYEAHIFIKELGLHLEYSSDLHDKHSDFPLAPENKPPPNCKSVVVLEETKQLYCGYVTFGCRRVRWTDVVDSISPQSTTSREDRQIVRMAVTDHSVATPTEAQHIESVTHHSLSARTFRRRLQQSVPSVRRPLLGLPLTQNHRCLRRQWCNERRMLAAERNEVVFIYESCICLQHHDGRIPVWRHHGDRMLINCIMHCHTGPALGIMVWGGIAYHSSTLLVRIADTLNSQHYISEVLEPVALPYLQVMSTAIFQQDNARPHVARIVQRFFSNHPIELRSWLALSPDFSWMENMWFMVAQRLSQITLPAATTDQLWQRVETTWSAVPQEHIQILFELMPRRVTVVISNNRGCSGY
ncbi:transposable element Tc1 transposase [Trichonephila clavipes]|nr:transposable element Tc1 transposase [Trichonephila clavipes]